MNEEKKSITVKEFTDIINSNVANQEHRPLEFWVGDKLYEIKSIGAYSVLPTVMIELKPVNDKVRNHKHA